MFELINYIWIGVAIITFLVLVIFKIKAPYGRHSNAKWGILIPNKWGWFIMELPAFLIMPIITIMGPTEKSELTYLLVLLWILHYFNRTFIFPFRLKTKNKKMPLLIVVSAILFNSINGFLNGYFLGYLNTEMSSIVSFNVMTGVFVFFTGMYINKTADKHLISLRTSNEGYQIPHGSLFKYISCPNHFGEVVEWVGFMIIACNLPSMTFAIWTFCNLSPRSLNHHNWYKEKFNNYPKNRKAILPYIL
tara:strand:+ start:56 stop:799 length:744 start_codon:yes stop_codon:yes gene_type:complete